MTRRKLTALGVLVAAIVGAFAGRRLALLPLQQASANEFWEALGAERLDGRFIAQTTIADCGQASLAELLHALGRRSVSRKLLRGIIGPTPGGITIGEMKQVAGRLGVPLVASRSHDAAWQRLRPPYILLLERRHYVTVLEALPNHILLADPAAGIYRVPHAALDAIRPRAVIQPRSVPPGPRPR